MIGHSALLLSVWLLSAQPCGADTRPQQKVLNEAPAHQGPFTPKFSTFVHEVLAEWKVPGISLAVIDGSETYTEVPPPIVTSLLVKYSIFCKLTRGPCQGFRLCHTSRYQGHTRYALAWCINHKGICCGRPCPPHPGERNFSSGAGERLVHAHLVHYP